MTPVEEGLAYWLNHYTADGDSQFVCAWRKRAWRALRPVVEQFLAQRALGVDVYADDLIAAIDAAAITAKIKPTGKRWKQEVQEILTIAKRTRELWSPPTRDEYGACLVASDMLELAAELDRVGRFAEAKAKRDEAHGLLIAQAPRRYGRPCPACGSGLGQPCVNILWNGGEMLVPHEARIAA